MIMRVSMQPRPWPAVPEQTARIARAAFPKPTLAMAIRDRLGEVFADTEFATAFGTRGAPATSPGLLMLVTALQYTENLTDRQAASMIARAIDWKYALGLELDDPGFDHSVLSKFRARIVANGLEHRALDLLLAALTEAGLLAAGGKARTDSTHVLGAVRDLNRLELAGESVRACVEALAVAVPGFLASVIDLADWNQRYGARVDSWRLPASRAKREQLAGQYGRDAVTLLRAVGSAPAPVWLPELPAVQALRVVLVQNYVIATDRSGREVVRRRDADTDGLPPGRARIASPYDLDVRWSSKGDTAWTGYKVHLTETCGDLPAPAGDPDNAETETAGDPEAAVAGQVPPRPSLITNVATTEATVPDVVMTAPIHRALAGRGLLPAEHYLDSGYPSADLMVDSWREHRIRLVTPMLADHSVQARAEAGFDKTAFTVDWDVQRAVCPQGASSTSWSPTRQRDTEVVVVKFPAAVCGPCPSRARCTTSRRGRQLTLRPRAQHEALAAARAEHGSADWREKYALRAGVEGGIGQAVAVTGLRRARYRGLPKTRLQHVFSAIAVNFVRLHAWWNSDPIDRGRSTHLTRLAQAQAA